MKAHRVAWRLAGYESDYNEHAYDCKEILYSLLRRKKFIGVGVQGRHNMIAPFKGLTYNSKESADAYPKIHPL